MSFILQNACAANSAGTTYEMKHCAPVGLSAHTSGLRLLNKCTFRSDLQLCFGRVGWIVPDLHNFCVAFLFVETAHSTTSASLYLAFNLFQTFCPSFTHSSLTHHTFYYSTVGGQSEAPSACVCVCPLVKHTQKKITKQIIKDHTEVRSLINDFSVCQNWLKSHCPLWTYPFSKLAGKTML